MSNNHFPNGTLKFVDFDIHFIEFGADIGLDFILKHVGMNKLRHFPGQTQHLHKLVGNGVDVVSALEGLEYLFPHGFTPARHLSLP